jgi:chitin disaccharide deacetylase
MLASQGVSHASTSTRLNLSGTVDSAPNQGHGLLIVNADDLGHDRDTTDATMECVAAGRITSATAMVFMDDSKRAASLFESAPIGVGLHLNVSEPFTERGAPAEVRACQARLTKRFQRDSARQLRRWIFDPVIQADIERCIANQMAEFRTLYGREPTHVDGHQHVHLSPNLFLARTLTSGIRMRNTLERYPLDRSLRGRLRALKQRAISRRFRSTDYIFDLPDVDTRRDRFGQAAKRLALSEEASVEVICHPGFPHEYECLMSPEWGLALRGRPLGSFGDLGIEAAARPREPAGVSGR